MPRKPSVQFLAGMGSQESSSKGSDHFEGRLLSEFQKSTSIDKLSYNKEQIFEPGEARVFDKGGLSNDRQKSDNSSSKGHFPRILQSLVSCPQTRKEMATSNRSECGKSIFAYSNFQDGNCQKYSRFASTGRVGNLTRPYRCVLPHTNTPTVSEISSLQCRRQILPVHCLALRNRYGSTRIHHGSKGGETDGSCRRQGIRIDQYIDDWVMRAKTKQQCQENTHRLIHLVQSLGWIINFEKSDLIPTQEIEFLGYKFDLRVGLVFPTQSKIDRLLEKTVSMLESPQTSPRKLMSLIGSMASMEKTIPLGRLHMRPLQWYLKTHWRYPQSLDIPVPVSQVLKQHLQWWTNLSNLKRGSPLHQKECNLLLFTDASLKGWGAHLEHHTASGLWNQVESRLHINILELKAVFLALKSFENQLLNQNLLVSTDNSSVVAYLNKQGDTHSQEMCALIWRIMAWTNARGIQIRAKHIPGNLNVLADSLSRKDKVIQTEWALNHRVFNQICHCWHQPMVDLFATKLNHKLPMYVSPVPDGRAWETDALNISWEGLDAYVFCPVALIPQVIQKMTTYR